MSKKPPPYESLLLAAGTNQVITCANQAVVDVPVKSTATSSETEVTLTVPETTRQAVTANTHTCF